MVAMAYVLDDRDEYNLQLIISLSALDVKIPITASLFNETVIPHFEAIHPEITILNPAKIAAPVFVAALDESIKRKFTYAPLKIKNDVPERPGSHLIKKLVISFASLVAIATAFFHFYEGLSWIDSLYFVVVTIATVGYGDINLVHSPVASKVFGIILILASTFFIWMIFSLTIDHLLKKRVQLALGRKKYNLKNHVIVSGLGRLGYAVVEELMRRGEQVIILEKNEESPYVSYFRNLGVDMYIGDAQIPRVLKDVCVGNAKALFSMIGRDSTNLDIGLNARSLNPGLRLILRIFDQEMAENIKKQLDIQLTYSMSAIADEKFFNLLKK